MCLKVFCKGDDAEYQRLREPACKLGAAFQKVNFLRDLKADFEGLNRTYFPNTNLNALDEEAKERIIKEIQEDFYISQFDDKRWAKAYPMPTYVNTDHNEGAPTISADGRSLIFVACIGVYYTAILIF